MPTLAPYRNYSDHDIIQNFTFNPSGSYPVAKGSFVKIISGVMTDQNLTLGAGPGAAYGNTVSPRWGIQPYVGLCTSSGDTALGMTLYDVKVTDENGELLIYHPEKAAQMQVSISGLPLPIVTRGIFLWSGIEGAAVTAPGNAVLGNNGGLTASGGAGTVVGKFLGPQDSKGYVYLKLNL